jgi:ubiquinone/menaquinone biosynthesis C-methylase UbiE
MKFYKELSKVYDIVFPKDEKTLNFLLKDLKSNSKVLDLACGTGTYSLSLALKGHRVDAIDLDEEMIQLAKGKGGLYANFVHGDMTKLQEEFQRKRYNLVYCIGNSIVHLKSKERIERLIKDIYEVLTEEGTLLIQIVNYNRIIKHDIKSLPTIERPEKGVKFIRNYNYRQEEETVEFKTELIINKNGKEEVYENSVDLIALQKDEIKDMFHKAGFRDIKIYGSFSEEEFNDEAFALIIEGMKR